MKSSYDSMLGSAYVGEGMGTLEKLSGKNSVSESLKPTPVVGIQELPDSGRKPIQGQKREIEALGGAKYENSKMV